MQNLYKQQKNRDFFHCSIEAIAFIEKRRSSSNASPWGRSQHSCLWDTKIAQGIFMGNNNIDNCIWWAMSSFKLPNIENRWEKNRVQNSWNIFLAKGVLFVAKKYILQHQRNIYPICQYLESRETCKKNPNMNCQPALGVSKFQRGGLLSQWLVPVELLVGEPHRISEFRQCQSQPEGTRGSSIPIINHPNDKQISNERIHSWWAIIL